MIKKEDTFGQKTNCELWYTVKPYFKICCPQGSEKFIFEY